MMAVVLVGLLPLLLVGWLVVLVRKPVSFTNDRYYFSISVLLVGRSFVRFLFLINNNNTAKLILRYSLAFLCRLKHTHR